MSKKSKIILLLLIVLLLLAYDANLDYDRPRKHQGADEPALQIVTATPEPTMAPPAASGPIRAQQSSRAKPKGVHDE